MILSQGLRVWTGCSECGESPIRALKFIGFAQINAKESRVCHVCDINVTRVNYFSRVGLHLMGPLILYAKQFGGPVNDPYIQNKKKH